MDSELTIIGAGPVGSLAAYSAASNGSDVTVLDQRKRIGHPDHCAGLISKSGLALLGLNDLPKKVIQNNDIQGARFFSPSGKSFVVKRKSAQAIVVNRELFDQFLVERSEKIGVNYLKGRKVSNISFDKKRKHVNINYFEVQKKNKKEIKTHSSFVSIIANGARSSLVEKTNCKAVPQTRYLSGYQLLVENVSDLNVNFVELFTSNKFAPGFFAWVIPINETTAKVGLVSSKKLSVEKLSYFMNKYPPVKDRFTKSTPLEKYGGKVIIRGLLKKTSTDGLLITGDAAGQTKDTTGGGVITGGLAAIIAGQVAAEAIKESKNNKQFMKTYDKQWKKALLKQFRTMAVFRWLVNRLTDKALEKAFETVITNDLDQLINQKGDIDSQAEILLALLKHPEVFKLIFRVLPNLQF